MLTYPFGVDFQRFQPLVLLEDRQVYAKTHGGDTRVALLTPAGAVHPLRPVVSLPDLEKEFRAGQGSEVRALLEQEVGRRRGAGGLDLLQYFVEVMAPQFLARDRDERFAPEARGLETLATASADLTALIELAPFPRPPFANCLWLCGRAWRLHAAPARPGCLQVRCADSVLLGTTGEFHTTGSLAAEWFTRVRQFVANAADGLLAEAVQGRASKSVQEAQEEVARTGAIGIGDLVYIARAGPPGTLPRLGYLLPHGKDWTIPVAARATALTIPFLLGQVPSSPEFYIRTAQGNWQPSRHAPCLGAPPLEPLPAARSIALPAYLRWAAMRIITNYPGGPLGPH